jgi:hypothetical protein
VLEIPINLLRLLDIFETISENDFITEEEYEFCRDGFWRELEKSVWNSEKCLGHAEDNEFLREDESLRREPTDGLRPCDCKKCLGYVEDNKFLRVDEYLRKEPKEGVHECDCECHSEPGVIDMPAFYDDDDNAVRVVPLLIEIP